MKKFDILKKLDLFTFNKLDQLKDSANFKNVIDTYASSEEKVQEIVKGAMAVAIILLPILFLSLFSMSNTGLKNELQLKEEIIEMAGTYIQDHGKVIAAEKRILGNTFITDVGTLQSKIVAAVNQSGVESTKLQISNFDVADLDGNIVEAKIDVKFSELSNDHLFNVISNLIQKEKIKIETLTANKNPANNLLDGLMVLYYFSKDDGK